MQCMEIDNTFNKKFYKRKVSVDRQHVQRRPLKMTARLKTFMEIWRTFQKRPWKQRLFFKSSSLRQLARFRDIHRETDRTFQRYSYRNRQDVLEIFIGKQTGRFRDIHIETNRTFQRYSYRNRQDVLEIFIQKQTGCFRDIHIETDRTFQRYSYRNRQDVLVKSRETDFLATSVQSVSKFQGSSFHDFKGIFKKRNAAGIKDKQCE